MLFFLPIDTTLTISDNPYSPRVNNQNARNNVKGTPTDYDTTCSKESGPNNLHYVDCPLVNQRTTFITDSNNNAPLAAAPIESPIVFDSSLDTNSTNDSILDLSLNTGDETLQTNCKNSTPCIRKSTRTTKAPTHLNDYVCYTTFHWCNLVSYESFTQEQDCVFKMLERTKDLQRGFKGSQVDRGHAQRTNSS